MEVGTISNSMCLSMRGSSCLSHYTTLQHIPPPLSLSTSALLCAHRKRAKTKTKTSPTAQHQLDDRQRNAGFAFKKPFLDQFRATPVHGGDKALIGLRATYLPAIHAYDGRGENVELLELETARSTFNGILNSPSLDVTSEKMSSMIKEEQSDSSSMLPNNRSSTTAKESSMLNSQEIEGSFSSTNRILDFKEALSVLDQGPDAVSTILYIPLLQECANKKSVMEARMVHAHIIKTGTQQDLYLSTSLVNVYAKCGVMEDSRKLFDMLSHRNIVTWTAVVTGYAQNSQPQEAMHIFIQLLESGSYPTNYTLGAALNICCSLLALKVGKQIHGYAIKYQVVTDSSVGNSLSSLYSKCRKLQSCLKVFNKVVDKNVISWTTIISACSDNGRADLGLSIFVDMLREDAKPNEFTLTSAMSLCCAAQDVRLGEQIHSLCIKYPCQSSLPVGNSIMYMYLKCGKADEAKRAIRNVENLNLITWNAMIAGYAQMMDLESDDVVSHSRGLEALEIFVQLKRSDMRPDLFSFSSVLAVCSGLTALEQGEQIHAQVVKTGCLSDVVVGSALVNMYNKCGTIEQASKAFVEMPTRTLISWTSMIAGYSQHGRSKEALLLFEDMRLAGLRPNQVTFVAILSACSHAGLVDEAQRYFRIMKEEYKIKPVMDHYACMVDMFVRQGRLEEAFEFIKTMPFEPNEVLWSILVAGCRSLGNMDLAFYAAERLLELRPKVAETYILLLNMYISTERWQDVSKVRKIMKEEKITSVKEWSWISVRQKLYSFTTNDRSHSQTTEMHGLLETLLEKAKGMGYDCHKGLEMMEETEEEKTFRFDVHHSEMLATAFGLLNTPEGSAVRVVKNVSMHKDCHSAVKYFSMLTGREIIVRDSKRLHKFRDGQCSCGDFAAFL